MNLVLESVLTKATSILDASIKSILVMALAAGLILAFRRASAATRHSIWFASLAALLLLPIFSLIVPAWQKPLWVLSTSVSPANEISLSIELEPTAVSQDLKVNDKPA